MVVWNMSSQGDTFGGDGFFVILGLYNIYFLLNHVLSTLLGTYTVK